MNVVYVTGNPGKAKYFSKLIGLDIKHHEADVHEIQSMDLKEVALFKAQQAYEQLGVPVIVEDTSLEISSLNGLPGTLIKWFEKTLDYDGICRLCDLSQDRSAVARNVHIYFDGKEPKVFEGMHEGEIPKKPEGKGGYGFNPIFIPAGDTRTMAEMSDVEFVQVYLKIKPIMQLKSFLQSIDK
jgi:XTP/dITP diphosphohydrolase